MKTNSYTVTLFQNVDYGVTFAASLVVWKIYILINSYSLKQSKSRHQPILLSVATVITAGLRIANNVLVWPVVAQATLWFRLHRVLNFASSQFLCWLG